MLIKLFTDAGWVAWPLGLCSVLSIAVILERLYTLSRLKTLEDRAFMILQLALEKGDESALRDPQIIGAPVAQVMESLTEMRGASENALQTAAEISISMQRLRLRRYLGMLATVGSTAPFIGLFGTVLGVMHAFEAMSTSTLSGEAMAAGISEALSATAVGLLVAIPAVMAYNYFTGMVQGSVLKIHSHVARLAPLLRNSERESREVRSAR